MGGSKSSVKKKNESLENLFDEIFLPIATARATAATTTQARATTSRAVVIVFQKSFENCIFTFCPLMHPTTAQSRSYC